MKEHNMIQPIDDCIHGDGLERSGISKRTGQPYRGLFCPDRVKDCKPEWLPANGPGDPRVLELNAVIESAKEKCKQAIDLARKARDEAIDAAKAAYEAQTADPSGDEPPF